MPLHRHLAAVEGAYGPIRREIEAFTMLARRAPRTEVARIATVVHVLHRTAAENISEAQVRSQLEVLNDDFRARNADIAAVPAAFAETAGDALVEFALATEDPQGKATNGITRTRTRQVAFDGEIGALDEQIKVESGALAWPADRYLNVWVCTLAGGLLGYAQFPGGPAERDGVVILNTAFGATGTVEEPFHAGRPATHEVGHWLNLLHIWGDDDLGCRGSDSVADTPNQAGSNVGCPAFPRVSCRNGPHGDMFMNFMDYTDDECMGLFTRGQVARMHATLAGPRASIVGEPEDEAGERLAPVGEFRAIAGALQAEHGQRPTLVFDGIDWV
jgi:hypothetical protein